MFATVLRFLALSLLLTPLQAATVSAIDVSSFWRDAAPWGEFLASVTTQRERWLGNWSRATAPPAMSERLRRSAHDVRFLIVAEDWCPDSVNTIPYIVKLAAAAGVETRILNRSAGAVLMDRHRTFDGRTVTPLVVVVREGHDIGAWIERPAVLQDLFRAMAGDPQKARSFANREAWYDADAGRTTLREIVELVDHVAARR